MQETFMLPDGSMTSEEDPYVSEWREFGRRLGDIFDSRLVAWDPDGDPGLTFKRNGRHGEFDIPLDIAHRILAEAEKK